MNTVNQKASLRKSIPNRIHLFLKQSKLSEIHSLIYQQLKRLNLDTNENIAIYYPFKEEVDLRVLHQEYSRIVYPRVKKDHSSELEWVFCDKNTQFKNDNGFFQPIGGEICPVHRISTFFVPALSFDRQGTRLGRGFGFYDRTLAQTKTEVKKIGVAWSVQVDTQLLPIDSWDIPMDLLLTEKWILYFQSGVHSC